MQDHTHLITLTDWLAAPVEQRRLALRPAFDRAVEKDKALEAWVQLAWNPTSTSGPLEAIPFGVKDSIETKGLLTEYGSPVYKGRIGTQDAALVTLLRERGAVVFGKTHTAAFAFRTPPPTRNPHNLAHTPGGSSSGSAAAVAAGMVPFTIGEQTLGSILRPASFCGVTGLKPTHGLLPVEGNLEVSSSLDTLGFFTHTPADMLALWRALGYATQQPAKLLFGVPDPLPPVDPIMATAFHSALARLREQGIEIQSVPIGDLLPGLLEATRTVMFYEGARCHHQRFLEHGARLEALAELVQSGLQISDDQYQAALGLIAEGKARMDTVYKTTPIVLTPAALGPAPLFRLGITGDPAMNAPWTALGGPTLALPMPVGDHLPLGLQLAAAPGNEAALLHAAVHLHDSLGSRSLLV